MDRRSYVGKPRTANNLHLAGFWVHFHIDNVATEGRPDGVVVVSGGGDHRPAGSQKFACQLLEGESATAVLLADEGPIIEVDVLSSAFPNECCSLAHLVLY